MSPAAGVKATIHFYSNLVPICKSIIACGRRFLGKVEEQDAINARDVLDHERRMRPMRFSHAPQDPRESSQPACGQRLQAWRNQACILAEEIFRLVQRASVNSRIERKRCAQHFLRQYPFNPVMLHQTFDMIDAEHRFGFSSGNGILRCGAGHFEPWNEPHRKQGPRSIRFYHISLVCLQLPQCSRRADGHLALPRQGARQQCRCAVFPLCCWPGDDTMLSDP